MRRALLFIATAASFLFVPATTGWRLYAVAA
jgi:hypothetical protein